MKIRVIEPAELRIRRERTMYDRPFALMGAEWLLDMDGIHAKASLEDSGRTAQAIRLAAHKPLVPPIVLAEDDGFDPDTDL